jgi:ribosomal protein S18 acetylase RimI-like enzyme
VTPVERRPAVTADESAITAIVRAAYVGYVERIGREPAPMTADHAAAIAAGEVTVAVDGDEVVGVLVVRPRGDDLLLENVAVAPAAQGRGIGRLLIGHAEDLARADGRPAVVLYTHARMTENRALYPALGYTEVGQVTEDGFARVYFRKEV